MEGSLFRRGVHGGRWGEMPLPCQFFRRNSLAARCGAKGDAMRDGSWKAWVVFVLLILAYGVVGEMECRDMERMQAMQPVIVEVARW